MAAHPDQGGSECGLGSPSQITELCFVQEGRRPSRLEESGTAELGWTRFRRRLGDEPYSVESQSIELRACHAVGVRRCVAVLMGLVDSAMAYSAPS